MFEEALADASRAADTAAGVSVWALDDGHVVAGMAAAFVLAQRFTAVAARLAREADGRGLPAKDGVPGLRRWLETRLRASSYEARKLAELGAALDTRPTVAAAVAAGGVTGEQARVIAAALDDLPRDTGPELIAEAERALLGYADQFAPAELRALGSRILAHVDPDAADRAQLAADERRNEQARRKRTVALTDVGDGRTRLTGWLDAEAAATLRAALDPLCKPLPADDRTPGQRRHDALIEICHLALTTATLPDNGGDRPQLTVTVEYDPLRRELGTGVLDSGERLTPAQVRRLACDARILPAILDSNSVPLDVGRAQRLVAGPMRRAVILRDRGCAFPGCDRPAKWCECHHIDPWHGGGVTSLHNTVLLCRYHHRLIHRSDWQVRLGRDHRPEFLPPATLDPRRTPRRNPYHHRT